MLQVHGCDKNEKCLKSIWPPRFPFFFCGNAPWHGGGGDEELRLGEPAQATARGRLLPARLLARELVDPARERRGMGSVGLSAAVVSKQKP